ncbi:DUF1003 domain-containing protein [Sphingomonas sp. S2-65]|uniref:DUF1003 domain-containing protein n=1 Tax=Sphingomonas sp. S2-65 TaxID=2903960 RepID=UPI001F1ACDD0|nr:DUF1003 domain-containing protein [Sphingomonas sp. S2-65]UYY57133.1 DUF1003 domain-containing protein [Sphingomonas sp. S2-65]
MNATLTHPSPKPPGLSSVLARNMQRMQDRRAQVQAEATLAERVSDAITKFAGSMTFVIIHALAYSAWIGINLKVVPGIQPFDSSFVVLAMEASVEAIFLSTFVLISQNRMMAAAAKQSDLDLQINLLAEHELTRLISLVDAMARKMGVEAIPAGELAEIKEDVSPEAVLDGLDEAQARAPAGGNR